MSELKLRPRTELVLDGHPYRVSPHPRIPMMAFAQEGGAGTVYRVEDPQGAYKALKVFHPSHRAPALVQTAEALRPWSAVPGLEVCDFRVLHTQNHRPLLQQFPQLTYAMVMPWIEGAAWQEIVLDEERALTQDQSLQFAAALVDSLAQLEQRGVAHCDLSGGNLLLPGLREGHAGHPIALVDIEQMHCPGRLRPDPCGAGSKGYRHLMSSAITYWSPKADRFAGAVLLSEVLGWCDPDVRAARAGETYFASDLPQNDMSLLEVLRKSLERRWGAAVARLLARAFASERLDDCPVFDEWRLALNHPGRRPTSARPAVSAPRIPIPEVVDRIRKLEERGQYREALEYGLSIQDEPGLPEGFRLELPLILEDLQGKLDGGAAPVRPGPAPARPEAPPRPGPARSAPQPMPAPPVQPMPAAPSSEAWGPAPAEPGPGSAWSDRPSARSSWGATTPLDDDIWESAMPAGGGQEHGEIVESGAGSRELREVRESGEALAPADDPWAAAPPAPVDDPWADAPPAPAGDPWAAAPPAPVDDPWADAPPAPVDDPWAAAPPPPADDPWADAPPAPVAGPAEDPWAAAPPAPVDDPWADTPPAPADDPWADAPPPPAAALVPRAPAPLSPAPEPEPEPEPAFVSDDELWSGPAPDPLHDDARGTWPSPPEGEIFAFPAPAEAPPAEAPVALAPPPPPPAEYVPPFLLAFEFTNADPVTGQFGILHDYGGGVNPDVVWIEVNGRKHGIEEAEQGLPVPSLTPGLNLLRFVMRGDKRCPIKEFRCEIVYDLPKVEGSPATEESPAAAFCLAVDDGRSHQTFPLDAERTVVGRSTDCDIVLIDASLTRRFRLAVERRGAKYVLVRENPACEVRLNGRTLEEDEVELTPEDTLALGNRTRIRFLPAEPASSGAGGGGADAVRSKA